MDRIILKKVPKKILVVKPSSLGDVVHSLPFLNSIRTCFPRAEIHWVIAKGLEGLLEGHPMVNRLIIINKDMWKRISNAGRTLQEIRRLFKDLREERYDLVIDLQGLFRSGIISAATSAPVRIGFAEAREGSRFFYTDSISGGRDVHAVDRYMRVAGALGCYSADIIFPFPLINDGPGIIYDMKKSPGDYAVIVPGARWDTKIWPAERFGKVASMLSLHSVVIGSKKDIALAEKVVALSQGKALSVAGNTTLGELVALMRGAKIVISNDSGPMHIAAGFNIPVVAIFGPTSPQRTGPYGKGHIVIKSDLPCAPCFKRKCGDLKCMDGITADIVYEKIRIFYDNKQ